MAIRLSIDSKSVMADPIRFRDPSNPPHRLWANADESDRFWGQFTHTTRSVLGLGSLLRLGLMSGVILPTRFRPICRSDSSPAPPRIHPKCCSDPEVHVGYWPIHGPALNVVTPNPRKLSKEDRPSDVWAFVVRKSGLGSTDNRRNP